MQRYRGMSLKDAFGEVQVIWEWGFLIDDQGKKVGGQIINGHIGKVQVIRFCSVSEGKSLLDFKMEDDVIWQGIWCEVRHRVNCVLGAGQLWDLTFLWEITLILKGIRLLRTGRAWAKGISAPSLFTQRRAIALSVMLFPLKVGPFLGTQFFQDSSLHWILACNVLAFVPLYSLESSKGSSIPSCSGSVLSLVLAQNILSFCPFSRKGILGIMVTLVQGSEFRSRVQNHDWLLQSTTSLPHREVLCMKLAPYFYNLSECGPTGLHT